MASSIPVSDDEIFRRKLLMDGEGMGDDRRINNLLKVVYKSSIVKDENEDITLAYERILQNIETCTFAMAKSCLIQKVNQAEIAKYEERYKTIENGIIQAQKAVIDKKAELLRSKRIRKNKQQYDALAKIIMPLPDRKESEAKLQELDKEIQDLDNVVSELSNRLEKRQKQFLVLLNAVCDINETLKEDGDVAEIPMEQ